MALVLADRVRETTTTTGTGTITLAGAVAGFQSFAVIGTGNTTYYTINGGAEWEVGIGTYSVTGPTLTRDTVLASSANGAKVDFPAGTKDVFVTYPAEKSVNYDDNGQVVIGVGGPSDNALLDVEGNIYAASAIRAGGGIDLPSGFGTYWRASLPSGAYQGGLTYNGGLRFYSGDVVTERMRIDSSGNVGIGTSSPASLLHLGTALPEIRFDDTDVSGVVQLRQSGAAFLLTVDPTNVDASSNFQVAVDGSERMRIDSSGNVGIGTSSPVARLRVAAGGTVNAPVLGNVTNYPAFFSNSDPAYGLGIGTNASDGHVWLQAQRSDSAVAYNLTLNEAGGNVGIGTTSPNSKLDVVGDVIIGAALTTGTGASTGDVRVELGANRTGNGPCYIDWHSTAGTDFESRIIRYGGANGGMDIINMGTGGMVISQEGAAPLVFKTTATERMRIDSSGNVGIGTSSPGYRLDVVSNDNTVFGYTLRLRGNAASSDASTIQFTDNAVSQQLGLIYCGTGEMSFRADGNKSQSFWTNGFERMRIDSTGRVGIGTSNPGSELEVADNGNNNDARITVRPNSTTISQFGASSTITLIDSSGTRSIVFYTNGTDRFIIDGTTGLLNSLPTYNSSAIGSTVVVTSTGAIRRTSSSIKYKKDVENLDPALVTNAVNNLRPVYYRTKNAEGDDKASWSHIGLIAEEVHEVEPRLVRYRTAEVLTDKEGNRVERELEVPEPEDVDYARLSVILLAKVKELETRIAVLEAR